MIDLCTGQTVANKPLTYRRRCEGEALTMTYELCCLIAIVAVCQLCTCEAVCLEELL